nr:glycosyltransferase family 4 protein [Chloroflexota bacterium]
MRIGIDYTSAVHQGAGIGRYTRQLVEALLELDAQNEYTLLTAGGLQLSQAQPIRSELVPKSSSPTVWRNSLALANYPRARMVRLPFSERFWTVLWHRLRVPLWVELFSGALDVFHSPDFALPPVRKAHTIVTVHDLSFLRVPQCSHPKLLAYLCQVVPSSVRHADVVLADSQCTKSDVIELLGVKADRVRVIYAGVGQEFQRVEDEKKLEAVRARYRLPARFVLSLGTLQPRKNFERLVEAYSQVKRETGDEIQLVIAGALGWMYDGIFKKVEALGLQGVVHFPGYVADDDLPALYSMADLFVFPSLYEGFGLPPLEAMACGTPVITSNVSSLPEVVGDAAWMVDPLDVGALANAMRQMLSEAALRSQMIARGLIQARYFTWSRAAEKLLDVYQAVQHGMTLRGSI